MSRARAADGAPSGPALRIRFTTSFDKACRLRDEGYEPIECAFGGHGSVLGPLAMDHHGVESHREGVALRSWRDHYGARRDDPRFVVTGSPDADAILAILGLTGRVPTDLVSSTLLAVAEQHDTDPIGHDLLATPEGELLAAYDQAYLPQSRKGFVDGVERMERLLLEGLSDERRTRVRKTDLKRREVAAGQVLCLYDGAGEVLEPPDDLMEQPLRRGEGTWAGRGLVALVQAKVWGFDVWYRAAPLVVSHSTRMKKVTLGCPDRATAEALFGPGGLLSVYPLLGEGWGGREAIGGSPRGEPLELEVARSVARRLATRCGSAPDEGADGR